MLLFSSLQSARKEKVSKVSTCQRFRRKAVYFTERNILLKQPIRIEYLIKQKPRGALAGKQERTRRGR